MNKHNLSLSHVYCFICNYKTRYWFLKKCDQGELYIVEVYEKVFFVCVCVCVCVCVVCVVCVCVCVCVCGVCVCVCKRSSMN